MSLFKRRPLEGFLALMPLCVKKNQEIDYEAIKKCVEYLEENKVPGFIAFGCMGQMYAPSENEFNKVCDVLVESSNKCVCVVSSTATNTKEAIRRAKYAEDAGADGSMLALPYAFPCQREMAINHYRLVDAALKGDLAIMVYNYPPLTGFNIDADVWKELIKFKSIKALKESNFSIDHRDSILFEIADKINVFSGIESTFWHDSQLGAKGSIGIFTWVAPKTMLKFYEECKRGNYRNDWVLEVHKRLVKAFYEMSNLGVPLLSYEAAILNALVEMSNNRVGPPREPYKPLPQTALRKLESAVKPLRELEETFSS
ncbi:MAG: dihydrodipicolinate synthase family protein [Candidatus Jordarchaeaceae archaeon]